MKARLRWNRPWFVGYALLALLWSRAEAVPTLTLARPLDQASFRVTTFATGLSFPTSMARLDDGSLLVAESVGSSLFGAASGRIVRLVDADRDGRADGPPQVVATTGIPGVVTSLVRSGSLVVALSAKPGNERITFWRTSADPAAALVPAGGLAFGFPSGFEHTTYALAARAVAGDSTGVEVYFNVGARGNDTSTPADVTVALSGTGVVFAGGPSAALAADSIHRVVVSSTGATLAVSAPQHVARGLRNAAGMTFDASGNLYLEDNGIDGTSAGGQPISLSADELNRIPAAMVGESVVDFGFAGTFVRYDDGVVVEPTPPNAEALAPIVAFRPIDGEKSEGAVEIAMAPPGFGPAFAGGVFTAFYGVWNGAEATNDENPIVFADPASGSAFHFIPNQLLGHPYGLLSTDESLFVSDLSSTGNIYTTVDGVPANEAGAIYMITAVPEPQVAIAAGIVIGALAAAKLRRRYDRP